MENMIYKLRLLRFILDVIKLVHEISKADGIHDELRTVNWNYQTLLGVKEYNDNDKNIKVKIEKKNDKSIKVNKARS